MKLIIDIPEEAYNRLLTEQHLPNRLDIEWCIVHGTPIPDNATNGQVMQMMFPNADIEIHNITVYVVFDIDSGNVISFDLAWWNSPYQKGGK